MSNFTFNVDVGDLSRGVVIKLEKAVEIGSDKGLDKMLKLAHEKVLANAKKHGVPTKTLSGLSVTSSDNGIIISIGGADVMYVEYGTGMVGSSNSHPDAAAVGWRYDVNSHGEMGWWYPTTQDDPNPTKTDGPYGPVAWTQGAKSRPFMYETYLWISENFNKVITKSIESEIKKLRL